MLARGLPTLEYYKQVRPLCGRVCASVAAALGYRAPTKQRKGELVGGGFTSALEGIYKSCLCMDITVCRQDRKKHRGPCAGTGAQAAAQRKPLFGL